MKFCKYRCDKCLSINIALKGDYLYRKNDRYFTWGSCIGCKIKEVNEGKIILLNQYNIVDARINEVIYRLEKYKGKIIEVKIIVNEISEFLNIVYLSIKHLCLRIGVFFYVCTFRVHLYFCKIYFLIMGIFTLKFGMIQKIHLHF